MSNSHKSILERIKNFIISSISYLDKFFKRKEIIDNMYNAVIKDKTSQINKLELNLKNLNLKNKKIVSKILTTRNSIDKKNELIKNIQDLTSKRIN